MKQRRTYTREFKLEGYENDCQNVYKVDWLAFQQENERKLIEKIRKGENFVPELSLVAKIDDEIVGHILFSRIKIVGQAVPKTTFTTP